MSNDAKHLTREELEAGFDEIDQSPTDEGVLEMIVRRPEIGEREVLEQGELDLVEGLAGDNWATRGSSRTADGSAHPLMQIAVMNTRVIDLVAGSRDRWPLAGDQLFIDLDLSADNLPPGSRLAIGSGVVEVTEQPHLGCKKFVERFGMEAIKFVNSGEGKKLRLRGLYVRVVEPGTIRPGDVARVQTRG